MYWNFLKEADGFKGTDKAVSQHLQNRIRRNIWLDTTKENLVVVTFILF